MKRVRNSEKGSISFMNEGKREKWFDGGFGDQGPDSIKPLQRYENHAGSEYAWNQHRQSRSSHWNRYNYIKKNNKNEYLLFNYSTNNHMYMMPEIKELISCNTGTIDRIESLHPNLYRFLKQKMFIVDESFDEVTDAIDRIRHKLSSPDYFELIINPTLDCNLKCWYCYETLKKNSCIDEDTLCSVMTFIKNKVESPELKELHISFFGGEPLLRFNKVIWPIIEFTQKLCAEKKKICYFSFTTNGVLLTRKIIDQLYAIGSNCVFQVPFDGSEVYHNQTKKYANGKGTFDKVINNVMYALSQGFKFTIRCNYTPDNLHSFDELVSLFNEYASECIDHGLLKFSYHRVWQTDQTEEMKRVLDDYQNKPNLLDMSFQYCYADRENSVVINYNGNVYNCTARDFNPEHREGYLSKNGEIVYNKKHQWRMDARYSNTNCLDCIIFPICNICTQYKLAGQENKQCLRYYSEQDKEKLLLKKIEMEMTSKLQEDSPHV